MVQTTWSQENGFNQSCPNGAKAGCTAVAMAQILRHWACRIKPSGSIGSVNIGATTYNWSNMSLNSANTDNALLIYHVGLSCDTNYGSSESSSTPGKARDGFVTNWGISSSADVRWRISHLNTWSNDLKNELNLERPILYSGSTIGGGSAHSWVIDGYNSSGQFHCNWGFYQGLYNDFYSLGSFAPGVNGPYNQYESAIFNVVPIQPTGVGSPLISPLTFRYDPVGYNLSITSVFGATSYQWSTSSGTITGNSTTAKLFSYSSTIVSVRAYNSRCQIYSQYSTALITIIDKDPIVKSISGPSSLGTYQPGTYYAELLNYDRPPYDYYWGTSPSSGVSITSYGQSASIMFTIPGNYQVVSKAHNSSGWSDYVMKMVIVTSGYRMAISPNPSTGETTIEMVNDSTDALTALTGWYLEIYDTMQRMKEKKTKINDKQTVLNTSSWKDGVYIVRAKIGDEIISEKLVVKH